MTPSADPLPSDFAAALAAARGPLGAIGRRVLYFEVIGSTNYVALELAAEAGSHGTVVIADRQTAGRGRRRRTWHSPHGAGLYVSVVLDAQGAGADPRRATGLTTLAAGVAVADGIEVATGLAPQIKWPNDLIVGRRKLAGILAESTGERERIVLGYGINVARAPLPPEVAGRATSLEGELGRPVDRAHVLAATLVELGRRHGDLMEGRFDAILDRWRARSPWSRGVRVTWTTPEGVRSGVTAGIADDGALLVRVADRIERLVGGEITCAWEG